MGIFETLLLVKTSSRLTQQKTVDRDFLFDGNGTTWEGVLAGLPMFED